MLQILSEGLEPAEWQLQYKYEGGGKRAFPKLHPHQSSINMQLNAKQMVPIKSPCLIELFNSFPTSLSHLVVVLSLFKGAKNHIHQFKLPS